jgi:hypothetical protein
VGKVAGANNRVRNEGERPSSDRLLNERRVNIDDPIAESGLCGGAAIMQFIGVKDMALARKAIPLLAPIFKRLDARQGHADGIGVMAVQ